MVTKGIGIVYVLKCPITNNIRYVGQTVVPIKQRLNKHISDSRRNKRHISCWVCSLLDKGLKPTIEMVERLDVSKLDDREIYYIDFYKKQGFDLTNADLGGQGRRVFSQQTKDKIAATLTGKKQSQETKDKRSVSSKATWSNPELKELKRKQTTDLISKGVLKCNKGLTTKKKGQPFAGDRKMLSESVKLHFSNVEVRNTQAIKMGQKAFCIYKAKMLYPANRFRKKSVIEIGELILEHINLTEACKILGINRVNATQSLQGKRGIVQGYIFKYKTAA